MTKADMDAEVERFLRSLDLSEPLTESSILLCQRKLMELVESGEIDMEQAIKAMRPTLKL